MREYKLSIVVTKLQLRRVTNTLCEGSLASVVKYQNCQSNSFSHFCKMQTQLDITLLIKPMTYK